ncbi:methionine aminotransferase [Sphaerobacter thermophilus]|uniref:Aminotransferase class I and II n=1 Tax=Sphaerobacter thermophilus (strain ATCC 49802 / DSM 20745 / KCCM 41009 / NCIMB 13125 / S 6022) TaxID=479434 RepID=D1C605_SPHTD|nr:methionine aminotransferase [Sphaerobacter thermophilus]ACZ39557.1 aminotransferase class I and II [Sphaerobacter thermophilus DSM 20745]
MQQVGASRLSGFGESVFSEMSRLAVEHEAINLGQGFPDFPGPDLVKHAAATAINADLNQYAPSHGLPRLRRAIATTFEQSYGRAVDPDAEVTVTSGATEALLATLLAILEPGDEVILIEPFYDAYPAQVVFAGGVPRYVPLQAPGWSLDLDALAAAISPRTRAIVLNTPHNPTGKVFSREELAGIAALCQEHDLIAISDEVYDRIIFDGAVHVPLATLPGMWERTVTVNSTGKTFSMTGWKVGYAIAASALTRAIRTTHQFITFATATPFQDAMAAAMEDALTSNYYAELAAMYTRLRDQLHQALEGAGLPVLPCRGSYFLLADISGLGFDTDVAFCRFLTTEVGVAAIPPSAFYADPATAPLLARFCFAKRPETIAAAAERLSALATFRHS